MNDVHRPEAAVSAPPERRSLRPFFVLGGVVILGVAGLIGYSVMTAGQESTDDATIEADLVPIAPRISGAIKEVTVVENQRVKAGELLFVIDDADPKVRLAQADAELAVARAQQAAAEANEQVISASAKGGLHSAKAQVSGSEVEVQSAESGVNVARAALERAQADAHKSEIDLQRMKELLAGNAVAQQQLDSAQAVYDSTHAALTQAKASLTASSDAKRAAVSHVADAQGMLAASTPIEAKIAAAHAQAELARARTQSAEASRALAQLELSYTKIFAPQSGEVSKLSVHPGQLVTQNQPLAELVPDASYIVANFKETQISQVRAGNRAEVELDAYPHQKFAGIVESLAGATGARFSLLPPDNASGNFVKVVQRVPVRIKWQELPAVPLNVGLSANVTVFAESKK